METWKRWDIIKYEPASLYAKSVINDDMGLTIILVDNIKKKKIIIKFNGTLYAYRFTLEGCLLRRLDYLRNSYTPDFYNRFLFKIKDSNYLKWLRDESYDVYGSDDFEHYVIYTPEEAIEILSPYEPDVEIQDIK